MRPPLTTADLCLCSQRSDLASFQQSQDFQTLDQGIRTLITTLSQGPKSFEELRIVTRKENEETREHISKALQQQQKQHQEKEYRKRLLDSLWFDEIYSREEKIVDAHRKTFEWIFDVSDHAMGPWNNFIQWLENGQGTYWINGKAGSGKSTLMSFLCQNDRTLEYLEFWSGNRGKNVLMPKFYFWSGGTQMQKSIEGLLRSLIWQVLHLLPDLDITSSAFQCRDMIPAWTERRLQNTLRSLIHQASGSHLLCFFIDGLDEYEGDQSDLIRFIQVLVQSNTVKVCLSSRPYRVFDQAFGTSAKLRLQDLTHSDIQKVVVDRFRGMPQFQPIAAQRSDWLDYITHSILARADGVFLWVNLAVNDQIRGLENGDSLEQLEERLKSLPDEVEGICARMLGQIEKLYRKEASMFLQIALHERYRFLLDFVLGSQDRLEDMLSSSDPLPVRELIMKSRSVRQRIVTTCAGLLEVNDAHEVESPERSNPVRGHMFLESEIASVEPDDTSSWEDASSKLKDVSLRSEGAALKPDNESDRTPSIRSIQYDGEATDDEILDLERKVTVDFIHRTARDFMRDGAAGGAFLKANTPSGFHPQVSFVKVLLAKKRLFESEPGNAEGIMDAIRSAENQTGVAQIQLCDLMDNVMGRIDRTCGSWPTKTHWSIRWGDIWWRYMHEEPLILDSKASSPSSSHESFHSVSSQPDTPDDLKMILVKKPNFLAFAVYCHLHRYVQRVIHDRKEPLDADTVNYLLYCAIHSFKKPIRIVNVGSAHDLGLINEFLSQGGSPNLRDSHRTIWSRFLGEVHRICIERSSVDEWELTRRAYIETTVAFVEKGADLHSIFDLSSQIISSDEDRYYYSLDLDLSALAVIELCSKDLVEDSHLKKLCDEKGAPYYSRCTQITKTKGQLRSRGKRLVLSDSESTAILELYKKSFDDGVSREKVENEMETYIKKLFQDRIEDMIEPDSP